MEALGCPQLFLCAFFFFFATCPAYSWISFSQHRAERLSCKLVPLLLLDGCNGAETLPLLQIIRLLSQSDKEWGDERLT